MKQIKKSIITILTCVFLFCITVTSFVAFPTNGVAATKETPALDKKVIICVGKKVRLKVTGTTKKVTWSSSDKEIVKVNKKGRIKGIKKGAAIVTAKVGEKKLTCKVKVKAAVSKITTDLAIENTGWKGITYYSDEIYIKSSNPDIATAAIVPSEDEVEKLYRTAADIVVFGHESGTATITITNDCNKEKVKFKVKVEKPEIEMSYQKIVDSVLLNGMVEEDTGDKVVYRKYSENNATAGIWYDTMSEELNYTYVETNSSAKVEWLMMPTEKDNTEVYMVMWIYPLDSAEKYYVTAVIDTATYAGQYITFEDGWYGTPAMESLQGIANEASKRALDSIDEMLKTEMGLTWRDIRR